MELVEEKVKVQTSEQARKHWSVGSGELPGEQSEELSDEHPMLRFAICDIRLSIGEPAGRMVSHVLCPT